MPSAFWGFGPRSNGVLEYCTPVACKNPFDLQALDQTVVNHESNIKAGSDNTKLRDKPTRKNNYSSTTGSSSPVLCIIYTHGLETGVCHSSSILVCES